MIRNSRLLFTIFFAIYIQNITGQPDSDVVSEIRSYLDELTSDDFSGTILVAESTQIIEERAFGWASIEFKVKNQVDTKFNIASISKMFTAVACLQLVEQEKVDLDAPVGKYMADYPNTLVRDSVTIHQLLTHTSGIGNFYVDRFLGSDKLSYRNVSDFLTLFARDTLSFHPGKEYLYSAGGYVVLGLIIEEVSGMPYYDYLRKHVFEPAQMVNTSELEIDSIVKNVARGYTSNFGKLTELKRNDYFLSKASPGGFHYSTAKDIFNFSKALFGHKLLSKKTTELMIQPKLKGYNTHIGYGIDVDQRYDQVILGHSGGWYGVRCELMHFVDDDLTVVVLSNIDDDGKSGASKVIDFFKELIADKTIED